MSSIRIQDDLYEFANHEWLEKAVIPADKPTTGGFAILAEKVEKDLISDFTEMEKTEQYPDEVMHNAIKLFKEFKNVKKKKKYGMKPVIKALAKFNKMADIKAFNRNVNSYVIENYPLPFNISVGPDMMDTNKNCVSITGPSTILPDASYYKEERAQQKAMMIDLWKNMATQILTYTKLTAEEQQLYLEDTLKFDEIIAKYVKTSEEWSEYVKSYNPMKVSRVATLLKPVKFKKLLEQLFGFVPETIIVEEPRYFKAFKEVFNEETFMMYKHWAYTTEIVNSTTFLSEELRDLGGSYRRALSGIAQMMDVEKFAYQYSSSLFSEPVGIYYGKKYFGEEAKKDIADIAHQIIEKYKVRISKNDFLSEQTKEKAILKLSKIGVKVGYPDKYEELYDKFIVDENVSLIENVCNILRLKKLDDFAKLNKPVDKTKWLMPGHLVNACYSPTSNDITFPAAILQAPFYSIKQTRSQNLGGIGAVIGHEISHAFDNNGAQCDENGNLNNWWTKEDFKKFNQRTKAMVKEFDGIELPWGKVNGSFIVSENIADNGGMGVTLDIMHDVADASFEEYFINWAKVWCMKAKEEYLKLLLTVDVHAPNVLRANMQPRNFTEWYDTFGVTKKDKMYLAPNKRVSIW